MASQPELPGPVSPASPGAATTPGIPPSPGAAITPVSPARPGAAVRPAHPKPVGAATGGSLRSVAVAYSHPLGFLLGLEGVALLRACAGDDFDREFAEARIAETRALLDAAPALDDGVEFSDISTADGYRIWSATYDEPGNPLIEVEEPVVRQILDRLPPGRALDAACGTGRHAEYLAGLGHRVTGVDSSPEMLARARGRVPAAGFLLGDLHRLPVPDGAMDLVVCALALVHVRALGPVMAEFARVLRPGGHLVVSDIHVLSLYLGGVALTSATFWT
jgi:Methyltransferase domain